MLRKCFKRLTLLLYSIKEVWYVGLVFIALSLVQLVKAAVVINEFQIEPSGASQWIELYNTDSTVKDISGWFIDDDGGTEKYTIPSGTILGAGNCISFQSGNFNWNAASNDSARLLEGTTVLDEYTYSGSPGESISFGRSPDGTGGFTTFSPSTRDKLNSTGNSCLAPPTPTPSFTPTPTSTPQPQPTATTAPTNTTAPTVTPSRSATPTPTRAPTPSRTPTPSAVRSPTPTGSALGIEITATSPGGLQPTATPEAKKQEPRSSLKPLIVSLLFVSAGLGLLALLFIWRKVNQRRHEET